MYPALAATFQFRRDHDHAVGPLAVLAFAAVLANQQQVHNVFVLHHAGVGPVPDYILRAQPLSDDCWEELIPRARGKSTVHFGLTILCGTNTSIATFELTLTPFEEHENRRNLK